MKTLMIICATLFFSTGCQLAKELNYAQHPSKSNSDYVQSIITSYPDRSFTNKLKSKVTLNFISSTSEDIRFRSNNQIIVDSCIIAAKTLGFKVEKDSKNCTNCLHVLPLQIFEVNETTTPAVSCSSYFGQYYGTSSCYTYQRTNRRNERWIGLSFHDPSSSKIIHQIDTYSQGYIASVIDVAKEMCYAALTTFPNKVENEIVKVSLDLVDETNK